MRHRFTALALGLLLLVVLAPGAQAQATGVTYHLFHFEGGAWVEYAPGDSFPAGGDQPGTNLWRYEYDLCNAGFSSGIRELNVFFNSDNVLCAAYDSAEQPADWTATPVGPFAPDNNWRIRYRTLVTASRVAQGTCGSFAVEFLWACNTLPGAQNYDAISTTGSDAGATTPAAPAPVESTTWGTIKSLY